MNYFNSYQTCYEFSITGKKISSKKFVSRIFYLSFSRLSLQNLSYWAINLKEHKTSPKAKAMKY